MYVFVTSLAKEFEDCRNILSLMYGAGVRKRFPNKADIQNNRKNPIKLAMHDIINSVDVSMEDDVELDGDVDLSKFCAVKTFIRWQWNAVTRLCTSTIRCIPLVVSSNSSTILSFLDKYNVDLARTVEEYEGFFVGATLWSRTHKRRFEVKSINPQNHTTTVIDKLDGTTSVITIDECKESFPII